MVFRVEEGLGTECVLTRSGTVGVRVHGRHGDRMRRLSTYQTHSQHRLQR